MWGLCFTKVPGSRSVFEHISITFLEAQWIHYILRHHREDCCFLRLGFSFFLYMPLFVGKRLHRFSYWCNLTIKRQIQSHTQMEVSFGAIWRLSVSPENSWTSRLQKIQTANLSTGEQLLFYCSANPWFQTPIPNSEMPHKVRPVLKYLKKIFLSAPLKHIFYSELCG